MASLMEELIQTLDAEEKCYSQLIPIEEEKTRAIIANDLEALQDITVREHDLVDETSALENKRERVAIDIATVLGRDPKTITLEQIASVLKNQPADQKKLQEVHDHFPEAEVKNFRYRNTDLTLFLYVRYPDEKSAFLQLLWVYNTNRALSGFPYFYRKDI